MRDELNSYFGEGIRMRGVLKFKGALRFDGHFEGEIHTEDTLIVGTSGKIEAKVMAGSLFNMGKINGDVKARKKISLFANSRLDGNIDTPSFISEEGAVFLGSCSMPEHPPASTDKRVTGQLEKALAENYPELVQGKPDYMGADHTGKTAKPSKPRKSRALAVAVVLLIALGASGAYFTVHSKNNLGSDRLSRYIYEKFAQNDTEKLYSLARTFFKEKEYREAARVYRRMLELSPGNGSLTRELALSLENAGMMDKAIVHYKSAMELNPDNREVAEKLRSYYIETGETDNLITLQEFLVEKSPDDAKAVRELYRLYAENGMNEKALNIYLEKIAQTPPTDSDLLTISGLQKSLDLVPDVIETLTKLVELKPNDVDSHVELAYAYHKAGLETKAVKEFFTVAKLDPNNIEALNNQGFINIGRKKTKRAIKFFNMALEQDKDNLRSFLGLATTYSWMGDGEQAEIYCKKILERDPNYSPGLNRLAWVYAQEKRNLDEAEKYSLQSMRYYKDLPDYLDTLSEVYYQKKEYDKAISHMERALSRKPGNKYFLAQMKKFKKAQKAAQSGT